MAKTADLVRWPGPGAGYFLITALISMAAGGRSIVPALRGELSNPDSYMRLVRLHEELAAGHTLHAVARDAGGAGTILHWSHLIDSLLVLLSLPFSWFTDMDTALRWAGCAVGPLSMGALGAALAWAVSPVTDKTHLWRTAVACALAPAILAYGVIGVVHHHVLLALIAAMAAGWALRLARGDGIAAGMALGAWAGFGIWVSPETAPFSLMAFGGAAAAWLCRPDTEGLRAGIAAAGTMMLAVVAVALLADPPSGGRFAFEIDRISGVWVGLGVTCCVAGWALALLPRAPGLIASGIAVLAWLACFPAVLRGTDGLMTPEQTHAMFDHITELQSASGIRELVHYLGSGILGAALLGWLAWRRRDPLLAYAALCAAVLVELGAVHLRFAAYPAALGAAMLSVALMLADQRRDAGVGGALQRTAIMAVFVLLPWSAGMLPWPTEAAAAVRAATAPLCSTRVAAAMLAPYAGRIVLTEPNDTPELLYRTGIRTVGSLYQRNPQAFMRLRAAWNSPSWAEPSAELDATGAGLLLVCPRATRQTGLQGPPVKLIDRLAAGEKPDWLRVIATEPSGYTLYERLR